MIDEELDKKELKALQAEVGKVDVNAKRPKRATANPALSGAKK